MSANWPCSISIAGHSSGSSQPDGFVLLLEDIVHFQIPSQAMFRSLAKEWVDNADLQAGTGSPQPFLWHCWDEPVGFRGQAVPLYPTVPWTIFFVAPGPLVELFFAEVVSSAVAYSLGADLALEFSFFVLSGIMKTIIKDQCQRH